jgi:large repetitive protein
MDFKNSDIVTGSAIADISGADAAVALEAAATLAVAMQAGNILPLTADGQLVLPAGVGLDDIKVAGRDLVIQMPDGTQMIVPDGAVFVPQIVVDGVAVPPLNIAALLIGQEPVPEAGRPQSSGGNFADAVGDIGDPFGLGDLLPPTQLAFPEPEEREIIPELNDEEPTTIIVTPDQPAGSVNATASVQEAALPARGSEPSGSNPTSTAETTTGTIVFDAPDGLGSVTLNGVAVAAVGQTFVTPLGTLTITSIAPGNIGYSYTLTDNTTSPSSNDIFAVVVTDSDGDTASANLTINIVDDAPTARNDTDSVAAGSYAAQTGNVVSGAGTTSGNAGADTQGADGALVSGVRAGTTAGGFSGVGTTINGQYGTLTIAADGSYTYTRNAGTPGGVNDVFTYQLTDSDGDTSSATLTISIDDAPPAVTLVPRTGEGTIVAESGLPPRGTEPPGSNAPAPTESTSGTVTFTPGDGPATVTINGTTITGPGQVITVPTGTLTITSYDPAGTIGYTFTLADNTSGDATSQVFTVTVTDADGDTDTEPFTITIVDDVPTARNDSATQSAENTPVVVNVMPNDTTGADGVNLTNGVALVAGSLSGTGSVAYNGDGTFTYTPGPGEEGTVTFQYRITDGDGDPSTATVTITLAEDSLPAVEVGGDRLADEAGLPARGSESQGSGEEAAEGANGDTSETTIGTIATSTGNDTVGSLVIGGVDVTNGGTITTAKGVLTVTLADGSYTYSYSLTDNTSGDTTTDSFSVLLTDSDGDTASDTLVINIVDDEPVARDDTDALPSGSYGPETGNVLSGEGTTSGATGTDTPGADGITVTAISGVESSGAPGDEIFGNYGKLVMQSDGSYSYVRYEGTPGNVIDTFTYTITDGDGDIRTATLEIAIRDSGTSLDVPTSGEAGTAVSELGLPSRTGESQGSGEQAAAGANGDASEATSGTITFTAPDGPATITIDGVGAPVVITAAGQTVQGVSGILTIDSFNAATGTITYTYVLTDNTSGNGTSETFKVTVADADDDSTTLDLVIAIADDTPDATDDSATQQFENTPVTVNVLNNDVQGADSVIMSTVTEVAGSLTGTGTLVNNGDGTFTYTQGAGETGDIFFRYTITDGDGDVSDALVKITLIEDSVPVVKSTTNLEVDEDGFKGANVDANPLQASPAETDSTESLTDTSGRAIVNFGSDVPLDLASAITLLDSPTLDGQLETLAGQPVTFELVAGELVGSADGLEVIRIAITGAVAGPDAGDVTYSYSVALSQPVKHTNDESENPELLTGISFQATDSDGDPVVGGFDVKIVDDVPSVDVTKDSGEEPILTTQDAETDGNPTEQDVATSSANFGAVFGLTSTAGADGAVAPALSFALNTAGGASGLTSQGVAINLYKVGNVIVGSTSASAPASATDASVVFAVSVASNGAVTLTQYQQVDHALPGEANGPYDDQFATLLDSAITLTASSTITDGDGDTASDSETVNIGANLKFADDGPSLTTAVPTAGALTVDDTSLNINDSASLAGLFTPDYGADGAGTVGDFRLGVSSVGAASGVFDTATGNQVFLRIEAGVVVGREGTNAADAVGGDIVFTVSVDSLGVVTLDQQRAVVHNDPNDPLELNASAVTLAANLVTLTATIADSDGDTNTGTANIGGAIRFEDDGPSIDAALGNDAAVLLTTQDAETIAALTDSAVSTGNFSGVFAVASSSYGNDGAGTTVWNYGLSVLNATSGLSSNGVAITLSVTAGVVEGRAGGALVFSIGVNTTTGVVTLTQFAEIDHSVEATTTAPFDDQFAVLANGLVRLTGTVTITDKDNDSVSEALNLDLGGNIRFADHGPSISSIGTAPTLTVDETTFGTNASSSFAANFVTDFGADGPGTMVYGLAVTAGPSGLVDTVTGQVVNLVLNGGVVEGRTAGSNELVFTVTVNSSGVVTLDQSRAVIHSPNSGPNQSTTLSAADLVRLTATSTDGDGDTAVATINIGQNLVFLDDAPTANVAALTGTVDEDGLTNGLADGTGDVAGTATTATGFVTSLFNAGADAPLTYQLTGSTAGLPALTSGGVAITYALAGNVLTASAGANTVFTLAVNTVTGQWDFALLRAVDHPSGLNENDIIINFGALVQATDKDGDPVTSTGSLTITIDDDSPLVSNLLAAGSVSVDETNSVPGGFPVTSNSGTAIISATLAYGADGAATSGTPAYALSLTGSGATSLVTALGDFPITLVQVNATTLAGQYTNGGTQTAFTVTVNATTGVVTLTQNIALEHNTDGPEGLAHNDVLSLAGLVTASVAITDRDGDSHSGNAQVGGNISFFDDGPSVTASAATNGALTVDETLLATNATANFAGLFTTLFGADGAAATNATAYSLGINAGSTGLVDVATGQAVLLSVVSGVVQGRTATSGDLVFTVSVSATGQVTLDQIRALAHTPNSGPNQPVSLAAANLITLTATVTDSDGDTDSASANIGNAMTFLDDTGTLGAFVGVTVVNAANIVGNGTFAYSQGADGHGSFSITGPALTGIIYNTVQNANGALLTATTDPDGAGGNPPITVFTLQVNTNGTYAFTLVTPSAASTETISLLGLSAGGPSPFVETPGGRVEFTGSGNGVNSSTQGFGIDNQFVGNGESFTIEFHNPGQVGNQPALTNPDMVGSITLRNDNINGSLLIRVTVFNDVANTSEVVYANLNVTGTSTIIDPVMAEFNRVLVEGIGGSGQGVRFTSLDISRTILPSDINLLFDVNATDRDGDITSTSTLNVFVDATAPVVIDLDGDGAEFIGIAAGVTFDYAGDGNPETTAWVGADDGLLAIDANGDGIVNDGSEIVFARDGLTDLQGLAADYDSNDDGVLTAADDGYALFGVWQDANSNGVADAGEFQSLSDVGIVGIGLVSDGIAYSAANGSVSVAGQSLYTKADGSTGIVADAAFATGATQSAATRSSDQLRTSNMTSSIVAASLVGLAADATPAFAELGDIRGTQMVQFDYQPFVSSFEPFNMASVHQDFARTSFAPTQDFAQHIGHVSTSLRAMDEADFGFGMQDAPVWQMSDLLGDSVIPVTSSGQSSMQTFGGGDMVMHQVLDMAAFGAPVGANDNMALSMASGPLAAGDVIRNAMPDMMMDRLVDSFSGDVGSSGDSVVANAAGTDALHGMLDQMIDTAHFSPIGNTDLLGSQQYEMATSNN